MGGFGWCFTVQGLMGSDVVVVDLEAVYYKAFVLLDCSDSLGSFSDGSVQPR